MKEIVSIFTLKYYSAFICLNFRKKYNQKMFVNYILDFIVTN